MAITHARIVEQSNMGIVVCRSCLSLRNTQWTDRLSKCLLKAMALLHSFAFFSIFYPDALFEDEVCQRRNARKESFTCLSSHSNCQAVYMFTDRWLLSVFSLWTQCRIEEKDHYKSCLSARKKLSMDIRLIGGMGNIGISSYRQIYWSMDGCDDAIRTFIANRESERREGREKN